MMLRKLARPFIRLAERGYASERWRRLMVEAREEFDDAVTLEVRGRPIRLRVASRMEHQRATGLMTNGPLSRIEDSTNERSDSDKRPQHGRRISATCARER